MSQIVLDAIASEVAKLTPVIGAPTGDLGYGTDLSCAEDLTEGMEEVSGQRLLAESIVRQLTTPRGSLPDVRGPGLRDMNHGLDLVSYLNRAVTDDEVRALASNVRSEVAKDDRYASVGATVTPSSTGSSLAVALRVVPKDTRIGPFDLILAVTSVGVLIDELRSVR